MEHLNIDSENVKATVENSLVIPQKLNIELPYYPAIPILTIYQKGLKKETLP